MCTLSQNGYGDTFTNEAGALASGALRQRSAPPTERSASGALHERSAKNPTTQTTQGSVGTLKRSAKKPNDPNNPRERGHP